MNFVKFAAVFISAALVTGCATRRGTTQLAGLTHQSVKDTICNGKTTKEEILDKFGTKYDMSEDNAGNEQWVYKLAVSRPGALSFVPYVNLVAANWKRKDYKLMVIFDENDVVIRHRFSSGQRRLTMWDDKDK